MNKISEKALNVLMLFFKINDHCECRFTSGIPEPHAYGAKALTSATARKAKSKAQKMYIR